MEAPAHWACRVWVLTALVGCPGDTRPPPKEKTASTSAETRAALPASKRLLGKWRLNINEVPDSALTKEFKKLKESGHADEMFIEYTFTETDFRLVKTGAGGLVKLRWNYQILEEEGDRLKLGREDTDGTIKKIGVTFKGPDLLVLGTGNGLVPLRRL